MPTKIGFTVVSSTGEDERYRATELNYHGPTVRGWRSAVHCSYPQEIVLQLGVIAVLHRIQILSHQYLIPQKIEIWISEGLDTEPSISPNTAETFDYLGFITLSDNQATGFKSRELKSITVPPTVARYIKLRLHSNHINEKNLYNQVGLVAVNVLGDEVPELDTNGDEVNNNGNYYNTLQSEPTLISNPQYLSPYDDLAFEMYVDKDVARIMRIMEAKKHQAVLEERFEYAGKLKMTLEDLREAGETLGKFEQEKKQAINTEDFDKAKMKKLQIDQYREQVYRVLRIDELLEIDGPLEENDLNSSGLINRTVRKQELTPPLLENLDTDQNGTIHRSMPLLNQNNADDKCDWDGTYKSVIDYNRPQTPNQMIHSQSQTSFEKYEDSPSQMGMQCLTYSNPKLVATPHYFSPPRYQQLTPLYNCHSWQPVHKLSTSQSASDMYYSMPTPNTDDKSIGTANDIYQDGDVRCQPVFNQKAVDFESPVVQTLEPELDAEEEAKCQPEPQRSRSPANSNASLTRSPPTNTSHRPNSLKGSLRRRNKFSGAISTKNSYEAYEERMLPALRHYHGNEIVRECQLGLVEPARKSKLNEREKKQAALPVSVFGIELVEKFYSKHFMDKEEGLKQLQDELKRKVNAENPTEASQHSPNKLARAAIFLLHRALRDKVYSVYSSAADTIRLFFSEYVPNRVSSAEVARSVERLLPELIAKSGDATPRIHNMAAHTLLSMADCKEVRELHIIPVHLSRPLTSSVHPRLALSRLEMIEQLILNHGISTDKQSGLTCRTLAEFGSSGLHHPAEAVRKVSERILIQVYRVNPRLVRKQLPPDDDITRRNLLYRQLFQEFDFMDLQRKRELDEKPGRSSSLSRANGSCSSKPTPTKWDVKQDANEEEFFAENPKSERNPPVQLPKKMVNQQTSPMKPFGPGGHPSREGCGGTDRQNGTSKDMAKSKIIAPSKMEYGEHKKANGQPDTRKVMARINEEKTDEGSMVADQEEDKEVEQDVTVKFPNLVDSVRVAEERLSFAQKGIRNLKSLKYIFPTTYIGNSTTSQASVNISNSVNSFCKMTKRPEWNKPTPPPYSGIPVPTNARYHLTPVTKKLGEEKLRTEGDANCEKQKEFPMEASMTESLLLNEESKTEVKEGKEDRVEGDSSSTSTIISPSEVNGNISGHGNKVKEPTQTFRMCIFCFASENWFTEESLNMHYWKNCPMLTRCAHCKEVVEIPGLIQHRLSDCEHKDHFAKCDICQEAIPRDMIRDHECIPSVSGNSKIRCPMCHTDLSKEDEWREHLMGTNICRHHPRKGDKGTTTKVDE